MRPPTLAELPPPPPGKFGWPWTESTAPPETMPDGSSWPRVSIVTPSYNQGQFLEETIRSVLLQSYPNLEYIVMDGGSTDGSVEIIRKYAPWLSHWASQPDKGQSEAINRGWTHATGEIVAYLNSDDLYLQDALHRAVLEFQSAPECALVYSSGLAIGTDGQPLYIQPSGPLDARRFLTGLARYTIPQPTAFMRRNALLEVGGLDEELHMAMDLDLWLKLALRYRFCYVTGKPLAALRWHVSQKTQTRILEDRLSSLAIFERTLGDPLCPPDITVHECNPYRRLCMDIGGIYLRKGDWRNSVRFFRRALLSNPLNTFYQIGYHFLLWLYTKAPMPVHTIVRSFKRRMHRISERTLADVLG